MNRRYCNPFIIEDVLREVFGLLSKKVKDQFLVPNDFGGYDLKPDFDTQRKVEAWFADLEESEENTRLKLGLYDLISNVLFFKQEGSRGLDFHFRISMEKTSSFQVPDPACAGKIQVDVCKLFLQAPG